MARATNVVSAFGEEQVERLTGLSRRQLRYWDRTGFFHPAFGADDRRVPFSRIYSFKDVASLRTLRVLRNQYDVPLQHLRKVAEKLAHLADDKWTATTLYVLNKTVVFVDEDTDQFREIVSDQYVIGLPLATVMADTRRDVDQLGVRATSELGHFERHRGVMRNALVIAGTRIPVKTVARFIEDGYGVEGVLAEYPTLTRADVEAVVLHAKTQKAA